MNLLLDIGNTSLRWALEEGGQLGPMTAVRHARGLPPDLLAAWETLERPGRVLASNVAGGALAEPLGRVVRAYWGSQPEFAVTRQDCLGIRVAYAEPARLGVDRWLALIGAAGLAATGGSAAECGALILDAGTAATLDVLAPGGRHLGGLILPGLDMMRESLLAGTRIPVGPPDPAPLPWAADTGAAVATGALQALASLTERVYQRFGDWLREGGVPAAVQSPRLLVTGGDGPAVGPLIGRPFELVPDLVLRGLARLLSAPVTPD